MIIAALYVEPRGCYANLPGVELWDEARDARGYAGPHPVVAHPPCARWCRLAGLVEKRWGHKRGADGGCFAAALGAVREFGGVLEHPAYSDAWPAFSLPAPPRSGGWVSTPCGGHVCHVEQGHYGHRARKATWLYARNVNLPELARGPSTATAWCTPGAHAAARGKEHTPMKRSERLATPVAFRDLLLSIARSARQEAA